MTALFELHFTAPLHIGKGKEDLGESAPLFHSDAMFSALLATAYKYAGVDLGLIDNNKQSNIGLSSLFPFGIDNQGKNVYFFPKPLGFLESEADNKRDAALDSKERKKRKKITFWDWSYFHHFATTGKNPEPKAEHVYGSFLTKKTLSPDWKPYYQFTESHAQIGRDADDSRPFYIQKINFFDKESNFGQTGLYFLVDGEPKLVERIGKLLTIIGEYDGIGTDRNLGNGRFKVSEPIDVSAKIPYSKKNNPEYFYNTGTLSPMAADINKLFGDKDAVASNAIGYQLLRRGGWITTEGLNTLRKKSLTMVAPGSLLKFVDTMDTNPIFTYGNTNNLAPDITNTGIEKIHPIYRSGRTVCIKIN